MESRQAEALVQCQRDYFRTGATLPVSFRLEGKHRRGGFESAVSGRLGDGKADKIRAGI